MAKKRYSSSFFLTSILYGGMITAFVFFYNQKIELNLAPEKKNEELVKFEIVEYIPPSPVVKTQPEIKPKPKPTPKPKIKPEPEPKKAVKKTIKKEIIPKKIVQKEKPTPKPKPKPEPKKVVKKTEPKKPTPKQKPQEIVETKKVKQLVAKKTPETQVKPTPVVDHKALQIKKDKYFSQIKHLIDQNKAYPKIAIRRGIEGLVKIQFTLSNDGKLLSYNIINGPRIFKRSIENAIKKTFPFHPPKDLFNHNIDLSLTLHYKLY